MMSNFKTYSARLVIELAEFTAENFEEASTRVENLLVLDDLVIDSLSHQAGQRTSTQMRMTVIELIEVIPENEDALYDV